MLSRLKAGNLGDVVAGEGSENEEDEEEEEEEEEGIVDGRVTTSALLNNTGNTASPKDMEEQTNAVEVLAKTLPVDEKNYVAEEDEDEIVLTEIRDDEHSESDVIATSAMDLKKTPHDALRESSERDLRMSAPTVSQAQKNIWASRQDAVNELQGEDFANSSAAASQTSSLGRHDSRSQDPYRAMSSASSLPGEVPGRKPQRVSSTTSVTDVQRRKPIGQTEEKIRRQNLIFRDHLGMTLSIMYMTVPRKLKKPTDSMQTCMEQVQEAVDNVRMTSSNVSAIQDMIRRIGLFCPMNIPDE